METKIPEAIRRNRVSRFVKIFSVLCLLALWIPNALADAASELASFSVFDKADLAEGERGSSAMEPGTPFGTKGPDPFRSSSLAVRREFFPADQRARQLSGAIARQRYAKALAGSSDQ
jgi:hypothetical protein